MPILNKEKLRTDVRKLCEEIERIQLRGAGKFIRKYPDDKIDFLKLWERIMKINEQVFKGEIELEETFKLLTKDEIFYLSRIMRYMYEFMADHDQKENPISENVKIESIDAGGVPAEWQTVPNAVEDKVILYIHGGGFILGSPNTHRLLTVAIGEETNMRVLSIDYRLAPENPFPACIEDCLTAYKWLLSTGIKPENIVIMGDSAGGNLTLVTLLKLKEEGIKLPVGGVSLSPLTDYTISDESFLEKAETDPILADIGTFWWPFAYAKDVDRSNPLISPLFGDLEGLPPLLFQVSKTEMLYSDSVRFVNKAKLAGVDASLQAWDDMPHVFQSFGLKILPEAREALTNIGEFVQKIIVVEKITA